jgi:hypothetical protein
MPDEPPALKAIVLCSRALGHHKLAAFALKERNASADTKADVLRFVAKLNPTWAEQMDQRACAFMREAVVPQMRRAIGGLSSRSDSAAYEFLLDVAIARGPHRRHSH